jgi:hypothetical protein
MKLPFLWALLPISLSRSCDFVCVTETEWAVLDPHRPMATVRSLYHLCLSFSDFFVSNSFPPSVWLPRKLSRKRSWNKFSSQLIDTAIISWKLSRIVTFHRIAALKIIVSFLASNRSISFSNGCKFMSFTAVLIFSLRIAWFCTFVAFSY